MLDVGAGSGYLTSVLYHLASSESDRGPATASAQQQQEDGTITGTDTSTTAAAVVVVGIEHIPELTSLAERNIRADGLGGAIDEQAIVLVTADGRLGTCRVPLYLSLSLKWRRIYKKKKRVRCEGPVRRDSRWRGGADDTARARGAARESGTDDHPRRDVLAEVHAGRQGRARADHAEGSLWCRGAWRCIALFFFCSWIIRRDD